MKLLKFALLFSLVSCSPFRQLRTDAPGHERLTQSVQVSDTTKIGTLTPWVGLQEMAAAKVLGVKYIRRTVTLDDTSTSGLRRLSANGFKVVLNVCWKKITNGPVPFPTDLDAYKKILSALLDTYKPEVLVIENEELNNAYHSGTVNDYLNELNVAIEVAHSKGVKVTNGGIGSTVAILLTYKNYITTGQLTAAKDFAARMIPATILGQATKPGRSLYLKLDTAQMLFNGLALSNVDFINFHWYQPGRIGDNNNDTAVDIKAISEVISFLSTSGHKVMSNEVGQLNTSPYTVTNTLDAFKGVSYLLWYSNDGGNGAKSLFNSDGSLRPNGVAFSNYITKLE